ncbi:MAG: TolC family protein [Nitrospirae bacterium]|nr:TolC family protein [Nitrospirota bacterium]
MKRTIFLLLIMTFSFVPAAHAEEIIGRGELVTLERAVQIGLKRHPNVLAGQGSVAVSEAKKGQAQAGYWPTLDATAGYGRVKSASGSSVSSLLSSGFSSSHSFEQYSAGAAAKQTIFDFGRTGTNVDIQKQNIEASKSDLENTEEQIILNVKQAYYNHLRAKRNRAVADETVNQFRQHLEQAKAFYEVGTKPKFDVTKAEVDLSNARLNLIVAENAVRLTMVSLNNAMGVPEAPDYTIEDNLSFTKYVVGLEDAVKKAYENRPELKALTARRIAAEKAVYGAKTGYFPMLTGSASWSWSGERPDTRDGGWNAGVALSIPIFSGFLTRNQVLEAKANLSILAANEEALRQNVLLEVQQNYLSLNEAEERIVTADLAVRQAKENHEIATGRYAAGVGNPIEVTDAEVALSNAKAAHIQALYDYKVGAASLEKAMGTR